MERKVRSPVYTTAFHKLVLGTPFFLFLFLSRHPLFGWPLKGWALPFLVCILGQVNGLLAKHWAAQLSVYHHIRLSTKILFLDYVLMIFFCYDDFLYSLIVVTCWLIDWSEINQLIKWICSFRSLFVHSFVRSFVHSLKTDYVYMVDLQVVNLFLRATMRRYLRFYPTSQNMSPSTTWTTATRRWPC